MPPAFPVDPFALESEILVGAWPLLGHKLDDRRAIRSRQAPALTELYTAHGEPVADDDQRLDFVCAPFDILVEYTGNQPTFHVLEFNGTGFGGISNMPGAVLAPVLASIREIAGSLTVHDGVVLLGVSGKEDPQRPRMNHLMHEKLLFAQALLRGLRDTHGRADLISADHLMAGHELRSGPVVVVGYMKDLIDQIALLPGRRLGVQSHAITGVLNDRFFLNVLDHFGVQADLEAVRPMNTCFVAGADKAVAYEMVKLAVDGTADADVLPGTEFVVVRDREHLITGVADWLRRGRRAVIKPHGTGIGHGIAFFLDPDEALDEVVARIDASINETEIFYRVRGGAFPYTVCDFIDSARIGQSGHPLIGHKYELRVVVYRDGGFLRAFPSVAKVASAPFDPARPTRAALINNVTASSERTARAGTTFSLPLADPESLETLGLEPSQLVELGAVLTRVMRRTLDDLRVRPARHGLRRPPGLAQRSHEPSFSV